jgi:hypothetical protein
LTEFTFEFIRRPVSPILSPSSRTLVEFNPREREYIFPNIERERERAPAVVKMRYAWEIFWEKIRMRRCVLKMNI